MGKAKLVLAAIILAVAIWGSIMVPPDLVVPVRLWPGGPDAPIPVFLMPLLGVAGGWAGMRLWRGIAASAAGPGGEGGAPPPDSLFAVVAVPVAALAVLVLVAVDAAAIEVPQAAVLLICGSLALIAGAYALAALHHGDAVELSSHWGGLGGGLGGWRLSPVTTMLLLTLIFLGTAVAVGGGGRGGEVKNESQSQNQSQSPGEANPTTNTSRAAPPPPANPAPAGNTGTVNATGPG